VGLEHLVRPGKYWLSFHSKRATSGSEREAMNDSLDDSSNWFPADGVWSVGTARQADC
jgi:hypothetical protein